MDQQNSVRATIETGGVAIGAKAATYAPALIEVYGSLGIEWVWVDFEHAGPSPWDSGVVDNYVRAAEVGGTELLVRVPDGDPARIRKVLDTGVRNLIVPRVDSAVEVRSIVEATRFEYDGRPGERGLGDWRSSHYATVDHTEYIDGEDENVLVGVIIEKASALEEIEEIVRVPDLGFIWIGVNDLCVQLEHPGDRDHPEVQDAITRIENAAKPVGVPLAGVAHDATLAAEVIDRGYQLVRLAGELEAVRSTLSDRLAHLEELQSNDTNE